MHEYLRGFYLLSLLALFLPGLGVASPITTQTILISEIQTGSSTSASEEFIELYNASDQAVDVSAYRLEYFSASTTVFSAPSRTIPLHGTLAPGKYYLVSSSDYLIDLAEDHFSATLAKSGGHVRLVSPSSLLPNQWITHDLVGWGTAAVPETATAAVPNGGESLQRKVDVTGLFIDTGNNSQDFAINAAPTPQSNPEPDEPADLPLEEPALPAEQQDPAEPPLSEQEQQTSEELASITTGGEETTLLPPQISELLPNPAPPQTDAEGEFIELYNPNPEPLDLNGFKLQTGTNFSYSFTFTDEVLPAGGYNAFYVSQTDTLLANSGGRARLIDPFGQIISETNTYEEAADGQAWALIGGTWQWTTTPTEDAANILTLPQIISKTTDKKVKATTNKKTSAKKSATKKTSAKKTAATTERAVYDEPQTTTLPPIHPGVLAGIGGLTLAYGGYEYKDDMANRFRRLRRHRAFRRGLRQTP